MWENHFAASNDHSLSLRPSGLLATLADQADRTLRSGQPTTAFYVLARWSGVTPEPVQR